MQPFHFLLVQQQDKDPFTTQQRLCDMHYYTSDIQEYRLVFSNQAQLLIILINAAVSGRDEIFMEALLHCRFCCVNVRWRMQAMIFWHYWSVNWCSWDLDKLYSFRTKGKPFHKTVLLWLLGLFASVWVTTGSQQGGFSLHVQWRNRIHNSQWEWMLLGIKIWMKSCQTQV